MDILHSAIFSQTMRADCSRTAHTTTVTAANASGKMYMYIPMEIIKIL